MIHTVYAFGLRVSAAALLAIVFPSLVLTSIVAAEDKKDVPAELQPFQGAWKVVKAIGKNAPPLKDEVRFTFDRNMLMIREGKGPPIMGACSIDSKKEPGEIDLIDAANQKSPGIYRFEKDGKLTLSYVTKPGSMRPKTMGEGEAVVVVLEKVEKKEIAKELLPFQGSWKVVKVEEGGKEPPAPLPMMRFTFSDDILSIVEDKGPPQLGVYSVDPKKEPAEIDFITPQHVKLVGIYKSEKNGSMLIVNLAMNPKALRPKKFNEAETITYTLEKVKE